MIDDLKEESIVNKVGGRFKLSALIQKRMVALNKGANPLVNLRTNDPMTIVLEEIKQGKIFLDMSELEDKIALGAQEAVRRAMQADVSAEIAGE
ncbi:MAG: DNA-directed RNA polymerase subunit omega [Planctomycetota bacterium]|nr:DNA-directed RNA polymerase subunit omega [Planctomycetota bacterium]